MNKIAENSVGVKPGLPEVCFSVLKTTGELIIIKRGESGYYRSDWSTNSKKDNEELADYINQRDGVTAAQRMAMEAGSMFGWHVPGADPEYCAKVLAMKADQEKKGE